MLLTSLASSLGIAIDHWERGGGCELSHVCVQASSAQEGGASHCLIEPFANRGVVGCYCFGTASLCSRAKVAVENATPGRAACTAGVLHHNSH